MGKKLEKIIKLVVSKIEKVKNEIEITRLESAASTTDGLAFLRFFTIFLSVFLSATVTIISESEIVKQKLNKIQIISQRSHSNSKNYKNNINNKGSWNFIAWKKESE